jgi:hypothetical protein
MDLAIGSSRLAGRGEMMAKPVRIERCGGRYVVGQRSTSRTRHRAALLRHLIVIARQASIKEFVAEVLPENVPMLKIFRKSGAPLQYET